MSMRHFYDFFRNADSVRVYRGRVSLPSSLVVQLKPNFLDGAIKSPKWVSGGFSPGKFFKIFNRYRLVLMHFGEENYHVWLHHFVGKNRRMSDYWNCCFSWAPGYPTYGGHRDDGLLWGMPPASLYPPQVGSRGRHVPQCLIASDVNESVKIQAYIRFLYRVKVVKLFHFSVASSQ